MVNQFEAEIIGKSAVAPGGEVNGRSGHPCRPGRGLPSRRPATGSALVLDAFTPSPGNGIEVPTRKGRPWTRRLGGVGVVLAWRQHTFMRHMNAKIGTPNSSLIVVAWF